MKRNKRLGLSRRKEFYLGLILSIILLLVLFFINASITYMNNRKETLEKIDIVTDTVENNLIKTLETIDNINKSTFLSAEFQDEVMGLYDEQLQNQSLGNILKIFESNVNGFDSMLIKDICYIPRDNTGELDMSSFIHYGYSSDFFTTDMEVNFNNIVSESLLSDNVNGKLFLTKLYSFGNVSDQICFARNVYSVRNQNYKEKMGIGIVIVNKTQLIDALNYSKIVDGLIISLNYNEDTAFYSNNANYDSIKSDPSIIKTNSLGVYDWSITSYYKLSYFFTAVKDNLFNSILIMTLIVGAYVLFYYMFHKKNLKSLYYMFDNFSQITKDTQLRSIEYIDDVEINHVIQAYNEMVESVNRLNENIILEKDKTLQYQIQRKDFEIKSLNAQINKHFIINVLSIIHSLTNLKQIENANYCLENLSDFLRYSLTMDTESHIDDELNNVKSYFNIQSIRYSKVNYTIDYDSSIKDIVVPKLIIQPLVENAYIHGLKKKVGNIEVSCKIENNTICISVIDDGGSISKEEVAEINNKIDSYDMIETVSDASHGIALTNIQKRLKFMYGDKASLSLDTVDGNKTISMIKIELE